MRACSSPPIPRRVERRAAPTGVPFLSAVGGPALLTPIPAGPGKGNAMGHWTNITVIPDVEAPMPVNVHGGNGTWVGAVHLDGVGVTIQSTDPHVLRRLASALLDAANELEQHVPAEAEAVAS